MDVPIKKYGDMVARKDAPSKSCKVKATGGPPTPTVVAINPLNPPAPNKSFLLRCGAKPLTFSPTANSNNTPNKTPKRSPEKACKATTPNTTPGNRPNNVHVKIGFST